MSQMTIPLFQYNSTIEQKIRERVEDSEILQYQHIELPYIRFTPSVSFDNVPQKHNLNELNGLFSGAETSNSSCFPVQEESMSTSTRSMPNIPHNSSYEIVRNMVMTSPIGLSHLRRMASAPPTLDDYNASNTFTNALRENSIGIPKPQVRRPIEQKYNMPPIMLPVKEVQLPLPTFTLAPPEESAFISMNMSLGSSINSSLASSLNGSLSNSPKIKPMVAPPTVPEWQKHPAPVLNIKPITMPYISRFNSDYTAPSPNIMQISPNTQYSPNVQYMQYSPAMPPHEYNNYNNCYDNYEYSGSNNSNNNYESYGGCAT